MNQQQPRHVARTDDTQVSLPSAARQGYGSIISGGVLSLLEDVAINVAPLCFARRVDKAGATITNAHDVLDALKRVDVDHSGLVLHLGSFAQESVKDLYREALRGAEERLTDACATWLGVSNRLLNVDSTGPRSWFPGIFGLMSHREQVQLVRVAAPTAAQVDVVRTLLWKLTDGMCSLAAVNDKALIVTAKLQNVVDDSKTIFSARERRLCEDIRKNTSIFQRIWSDHRRAVSEETIRARFFGERAETSSSVERFEMFVSYWKAVWSSLDQLQEVMTQSRDAIRTALTETTSTQGHQGFDSGNAVSQALRATGKGWKENCEAVTRGLQEAREELQRDAARTKG